jgi:hypothetical protein
MLARLDLEGTSAHIPALPRLGLLVGEIQGHLRMFPGLLLDDGSRLMWAPEVESCGAFWAGPVDISISN